MFLSLILAVALAEADQAKHDALELAMYQKMHSYQDAIAEIWRPSPKLLSDYRAARRCYTQFHLYKTESCSAEFYKVEVDLGRPKG